MYVCMYVVVIYIFTLNTYSYSYSLFWCLLCAVLNSEVTDLKACLQKQEIQLDLKLQELKEAVGKVSIKYCRIG